MSRTVAYYGKNRQIVAPLKFGKFIFANLNSPVWREGFSRIFSLGLHTKEYKREMKEMVEEKEKKEKKVGSDRLKDPKVNVRILLAAFWISHFLLWTFGDMVALLQHKSPDPIDNDLILLVAASLAIIQTLMIVFSLIGKPKFVRLANIIVPIVFLLFNIGFISEAVDG